MTNNETVPPAAAGLPAGTLEAAEIGANRLDSWARSPQGKNFLAHALVQLARTGWLRTEPGAGFEPTPAQEPMEPAPTESAGTPPPADHTTHCDRIEVWPLARVLSEVRCGSADWSWEEEWADLDRRHAQTGYLDTLEAQIRERGITMPVLVGSDGRLWDGHHRLRIAVRAGIPYVPVELTPPIEAAPSTTDRTAILRETVTEALQHDSVRCPLCPGTLTLHTPSGARAHFTTVHPEQKITGRETGPWPMLLGPEAALVLPTTDRAAAQELIAETLAEYDLAYFSRQRRYAVAEEVLTAMLGHLGDETPNTDQGAVLRWAADRMARKASALSENLHNLAFDVVTDRLREAEILDREAAELRRLADETPDTTPQPAENPARIDSLRPEFAEHASVEAIDAQLDRARRQERRWHLRIEWLTRLRTTRVAQKERGEWPAAGARQDEVWPVQESTRCYAEELRTTPGQASADGHAGWECDAGAQLLISASTPGPGALGTHHGTVYACPAHRGAALQRITGSGYQADPRPAPSGHRWNPWPCGHVTAHDSAALTALTAARARQDGVRES